MWTSIDWSSKCMVQANLGMQGPLICYRIRQGSRWLDVCPHGLTFVVTAHVTKPHCTCTSGSLLNVYISLVIAMDNSLGRRCLVNPAAHHISSFPPSLPPSSLPPSSLPPSLPPSLLPSSPPSLSGGSGGSRSRVPAHRGLKQHGGRSGE